MSESRYADPVTAAELERQARRIAELEAALRRGIDCIERILPMVMWDGIEGENDDGETSVTLMLMRETLSN